MGETCGEVVAERAEVEVLEGEAWSVEEIRERWRRLGGSRS